MPRKGDGSFYMLFGMAITIQVQILSPGESDQFSWHMPITSPAAEMLRQMGQLAP